FFFALRPAKAHRALRFVFLSWNVVCALLAGGNITGIEATIHIAGWVGLVCGASAIYLSMGEVLNEQFGRTILPIGEAH
uniref:acetate uptake transporter n=1 Tax=Salmonella enterica TaxID=28901 RepID=UPI00398C318A